MPSLKTGTLIGVRESSERVAANIAAGASRQSNAPPRWAG
jgi:hypothetical protein